MARSTAWWTCGALARGVGAGSPAGAGRATQSPRRTQASEDVRVTDRSSSSGTSGAAWNVTASHSGTPVPGRPTGTRPTWTRETTPSEKSVKDEDDRSPYDGVR